jgi:predicted O-methyltransferase YrrM
VCRLQRWSCGDPMNEPISTGLYRYEVQQLAKVERPRTIVEVGVYCGDLSRMLLSISSVERLVLVDPWSPGWKTKEHMDAIARSVAAWAETDSRVEILRMPSIRAADKFVSQVVDFLHIDGNHEYEGVLSDIKAWRGRMRPGGLMTGDNFEIPGVAKAVREYFGTNARLMGKGRIWIARV